MIIFWIRNHSSTKGRFGKCGVGLNFSSVVKRRNLRNGRGVREVESPTASCYTTHFSTYFNFLSQSVHDMTILFEFLNRIRFMRNLRPP